MVVGRIAESGKEGELPLSSEIRLPLADFEELVSEALPKGLPPMRDVQHAIDLIPGAVLPNQVAYRMPPQQREEIRRQVEDLIAKKLEQVQVLVQFQLYLHRRKMLHGECA